MKSVKRPSWAEIRKMPIRMYQSVRGPIMGHIEFERTNAVRVWAPAHVGSPEPGKVLWMPLAFCEEYIDLDPRSAAFFGTHPVPDVVAAGYREYVAAFMQGSYKMKPVKAELGVDAATIVRTDPRVPQEAPVAPAPRTTVCGSCGAGPNSSHKASCASLKARATCASCGCPGHPGQQCTMSKGTDGGVETCGCLTHVPRLESVPPAAHPTVTIGEPPTEK